MASVDLDCSDHCGGEWFRYYIHRNIESRLIQPLSGKSTILKLITRIYDPTEGTILIDDQDIKTLKLENLRQVLACLFQDYTHFPLDVCHSATFLTNN